MSVEDDRKSLDEHVHEFDQESRLEEEVENTKRPPFILTINEIKLLGITGVGFLYLLICNFIIYYFRSVFFLMVSLCYQYTTLLAYIS
jgi:hypothetical protein